ncbi:MAG TPA: SCO family protein [Dongiaceae bacterium]|nr:SCO family protein [Dongiaceae bacterium]
MNVPFLKLRAGAGIALIAALAAAFNAPAADEVPPPDRDAAAVRTFAGTGVVQEVGSNEQTIVIRHEAISNYMVAMTMPFQVKAATELAGVLRGDKITFQLHVTADDSWVSDIERIGTVALPALTAPAASPAVAAPGPNPLLDYKFTNELGQAVSLNDFRGQVLALTFFYTRCPLPNACPRLSRNFEEAAQKLAALPRAPARWHCLSISFDPGYDTPATLKAYGESYHYDPEHWSFLTGSPDKIGELARACGMEYAPDGGTIQHNFRTLIIDAAGHLQMVFPMGGDLSDQIVAQILQAAAATNVVAKAGGP